MQEQVNTTDPYLNITDVAKVAPGRPSTNCVWRWCRRGLKSRTGERVRLQHVRFGGMIYTTRAWLNEFGRRLAEADARYFDLCDAAAKEGGNHAKTKALSSQFEQHRREAIEEAHRELDQAGI